MDDLISRQAAINWIINLSADIGKIQHQDLWHYEQALDEIRALLEQTAEPRTGKWIPNNVVNAVCPWCCSECNSNQMDRTPYCQMCGARMEE